MSQTPPLLLQNIDTLVTMVDGEAPLRAVDLLLENGRVSAIGRDLPRPDGEVRHR